MPSHEDRNKAELTFLKGGGEMGELTRSYDWENSCLGKPEHWPQSLKTIINIILNSKFPMFLYWGPELTCFYNDAFRPSLGNEGKHPSILGMPGEQAWAEIWDIVKPLFDRVFAGESIWREDQLIPIYRNGKMDDIYWTFSYSPALDDFGKVTGILVNCTETTAKVTAINELTIYKQNIQNMIKQAPVGMCIVSGEPLYVDEINDLFLEIVGKNREQFIGIPYWDVISEAKALYKPVTDHVMRTGETYHAKEHEIMLIRQGSPETVFVDFVYEPMLSADGKVIAIMIVATEVTDKILARRLLQKNNDEMAATNEEVVAANEELTVTNEELAQAKEYLQELVDELDKSKVRILNQQQRLESFFMQAPAGICILSGPDLVFELINPLYQQFFPGRDILGKAMLEAIPEVKGAPIWDILQNVYNTGKTFEGNELLIPLARTDNGPVEDRYFDFIYQARLNDEQKVDGILVFVIEVTDTVLSKIEIEKSRATLQKLNEELTASKLELQKAEQMLRFAVEAANIGTYIIDAKEQKLIASPRLKELFGYYPDEEMPYEAAVNNITDDFRDKVIAGVEAALEKGEDFDMEYKILGYHDQKLRWVRAIGKVDKNIKEDNVYFSGALIDITEQKADEQRKNDFIGMVSHELKTPLTSLTALILVLNNKLKNSEDAFVAGALDKASIQVKKMNKMINGFLNIAMLESGRIVINKQRFNLDELLREIIKEMELTVSTHSILFDQGKPTMIYADREKIGSVISNLLSNAIKYSPKGKSVEVECEIIGSTALVSFKDQGIGIKPEDKNKLFERFYRVESNDTRHISGFGIGLYLSAEIIERHGGKIWVESQNNAGSTFYFSLPLA